jgi:hypothetical protein
MEAEFDEAAKLMGELLKLQDPASRMDALDRLFDAIANGVFTGTVLSDQEMDALQERMFQRLRELQDD